MIIPLKNTTAQSFRIQEGDQAFTLDIIWNDRLQCLVLYVTNVDTGVMVVGGVKMLFGNDMLFSWRGKQGGLSGTLYLYDNGQTKERPNWENLEETELEYLSVAVR